MSSRPERHIFASGGLLEGPGPAPLVEAMLRQARSGRTRPTLVLLPTADETDPGEIDLVRRAGDDAGAEVHVQRLYPRPDPPEPVAAVRSADVVFATGGSTLSLLTLWRAHGLDTALREAWGAGVVLGGYSAGALCWFESGLTSSYGTDLSPIGGGLGLLSGSFCPHYGDDPRRPRYLEEVGAGRLAPGLACDNGAVAHFVGIELVEVLVDQPEAAAWRVDVDDRGTVVEHLLAPGTF